MKRSLQDSRLMVWNMRKNTDSRPASHSSWSCVQPPSGELMKRRIFVWKSIKYETIITVEYSDLLAKGLRTPMRIQTFTVYSSCSVLMSLWTHFQFWMNHLISWSCTQTSTCEHRCPGTTSAAEGEHLNFQELTKTRKLLGCLEARERVFLVSFSISNLTEKYCVEMRCIQLSRLR